MSTRRQQKQRRPATEGALGPRDAWRPIHPGEAFHWSRSYVRQMLAQRLYYAAVAAAQRRAARAATGRYVPRGDPMSTRPQLGPLLSDLPARLAAQAGIGHSAYLEYQDRRRDRPLAGRLSDEAIGELRTVVYGVTAPDLETFGRLARICTEALETRLSLFALEAEEGLSSVELYRVFLASQCQLPLRTTAQVIRAVVLFGDLLLPLVDRTIEQMHPGLQLQYRVASSVGRLHETRLRLGGETPLLRRAAEYGEQLIVALGSLLPVTRRTRHEGPMPSGQPSRHTAGTYAGGRKPCHLPGLPAVDLDVLDDLPVAPLDAPAHPDLDEPAGGIEEAVMGNIGASADEGGMVRKLAMAALQQELSQTLAAANDSKGVVADPRPDEVERMLRKSGFEAGPLQGNPIGMSDVGKVLGWDDEASVGASIQYEVLVPPEDPTEYEELRRRAAPLVQRLRRLVYPDSLERLTRRRFCSSGAPDPARLPLFGFSDIIYRRTDKRGCRAEDGRRSSCVLLACDASGSMKAPELGLLKLLTCAFAESLHDARGVRVLAGAYHTASLGGLPEGPVVRWLLHPRLTPALSVRQAARAVTALPPAGRGVNHDALSLSYMLEEARSLMPRGTCYVVVLTDGKFNARVRGEDGDAEMERLMSDAKETPGFAVHFTLVAIGKPAGYELAGADRILTVQTDMAEDQAALVERIASFVAKDVGRQRESTVGRRRRTA